VGTILIFFTPHFDLQRKAKLNASAFQKREKELTHEGGTWLVFSLGVPVGTSYDILSLSIFGLPSFIFLSLSFPRSLFLPPLSAPKCSKGQHFFLFVETKQLF
jgi:hypothetical protein